MNTNLKKRTLLLLLLILVIVPSIHAEEYFVSSASAIYDLINTVQPGDTITMRNGLWVDQNIVFHGNCTEADPILLRAEDPGYVRLHGKSRLEFSGSWITVDGLLFKNGHSTQSDAVIEFRSSFGRAENCRLTNTVIADYNPSSKDTDYKWVSMYGRYNRVDHCHFEGKTHKGTTLVVWLSSGDDRVNYHRIDHNYFGPRPELGYNGGETVRVGTSDYSMTDSYTIVEYNVFEECNGETEIISNKSCENIYQYNTFINNEGCLTLRHGNRCTVRGNFFFGNNRGNTGGVRIIGEDHLVYNNYFDGLNGSGYKSALCIVKGVENSPLNRYFQVKRAMVAFNTFVDCRNTLVIGYGTSDDQTLPPEDCIIANNAVQTSYQIARIGDSEGTPVNFAWEGNIFWGNQLGIENPGGIDWQNPELTTAGDGLFRPFMGSPLIDAAVGEYTQITSDMDGQTRMAPLDVGCDELSSEPVVIRPLSSEDVGVNWFISGPVAVEVIAGENTLSEAVSLSGTEDTLKLVTDGGIYQLSENFIIDRRVIIKAANGLSQKPVITRSNTGSDTPLLFEMRGLGELYVKGAILDGGADSQSSLKALIGTGETPFSEYFRIIADDCDFQAVHYSGDGSVLNINPGMKADSIKFTNCTLMDCDGIALSLKDEEIGSGKFNVSYMELSNCTFWNIAREAVNIYGDDDNPWSFGPTIHINHCTFDNCGNDGTSILNLMEIDNAIVTNSIFSNSPTDTFSVRLFGWAYIDFCDVFNASPVELNRGASANKDSGMVSLDPEYRNPVEGDFSLAVSSPVRGIGNDGEALGDLRWADGAVNSIGSDQIAILDGFKLQQNYPNPFNSSTRISYTLLRSAFVEVQIFDLRGSLIARFNQQEQSPGEYAIDWQASDISSGVYICRLQVNDQSKMIKMVFVK